MASSKQMSHRKAAVMLMLATQIMTTTAFVGSSFQRQQQVPMGVSVRPFSSFVSKLWLKKGRKGKLGSLFTDDGTTASPAPKQSRQTTATSTRNKKTTASTKTNSKQGSVSPDLAAWMARESSSSSTNSATTTTTTNLQPEDDESGSVFTSFEGDDSKSKSKKQKGRRTKESSSQASTADTVRRDGQVKLLLKELEETLAKKEKTVADILSTVRQLTQLNSDNLRQLAAGSAARDYRLAWVGSDDAVTYLGTGLHKVPLARLQEVFLSMQGKSRIQVLEVIRILGPFPNIKNTLQGVCKVDKLSEDATGWSLEWDSMVDGTGKELIAGKEENRQTVDLQVYYCDSSVLVAIVPPPSGSLRADPLEQDGANVMVFVREKDLDGKLETLRVV
jgi:hypothetical protein